LLFPLCLPLSLFFFPSLSLSLSLSFSLSFFSRLFSARPEVVRRECSGMKRRGRCGDGRVSGIANMFLLTAWRFISNSLDGVFFLSRFDIHLSGIHSWRTSDSRDAEWALAKFLYPSREGHLSRYHGGPLVRAFHGLSRRHF